MALDLVCLSHLRWDFVYQRPQHLMSRFARDQRVFYVEEPVPDSAEPYIELNSRQGVTVVKLHMAGALDEASVEALSRRMLDQLFEEHAINEYVLWFYSPMMLGVSRHLVQDASAVVYDCMDELSHFWLAPSELRARETELFGCADIVFTGGISLYESKKRFHSNVHPFPSSVDVRHFIAARDGIAEPEDQARLAHPRVGFYGAVDERMDFELLRRIAALRPKWQFVIVGEVVKVERAVLPTSANVHYLGLKKYEQLPAYLSGWEAAMLPFALNLSTRYISPTKIPEYLAAGRPVVSTSIPDVVRTYGDAQLVHIADEPDQFVQALEQAMAADRDWLGRVDQFLATTSWDETWRSMRELLDAELAENAATDAASSAAAGAE